jgi:hypothetical protein
VGLITDAATTRPRVFKCAKNWVCEYVGLAWWGRGDAAPRRARLTEGGRCRQQDDFVDSAFLSLKPLTGDGYKPMDAENM